MKEETDIRALFNDRAGYYIKNRPSYPLELIMVLEEPNLDEDGGEGIQ